MFVRVYQRCKFYYGRCNSHGQCSLPFVSVSFFLPSHRSGGIGTAGPTIRDDARGDGSTAVQTQVVTGILASVSNEIKRVERKTETNDCQAGMAAVDGEDESACNIAGITDTTVTKEAAETMEDFRPTTEVVRASTSTVEQNVALGAPDTTAALAHNTSKNVADDISAASSYKTKLESASQVENAVNATSLDKEAATSDRTFGFTFKTDDLFEETKKEMSTDRHTRSLTKKAVPAKLGVTNTDNTAFVPKDVADTTAASSFKINDMRVATGMVFGDATNKFDGVEKENYKDDAGTKNDSPSASFGTQPCRYVSPR